MPNKLLFLLPALLSLTSALPAEKPRLAPERVEVSLVLLDVVVTGKGGQPVAGLGLSDFDLLVDNSRVSLESVEDRCAEPASSPHGETDVALSNGASVAPDTRHFIILFDMSHLSALPRRNAVNSVLGFVNEAMTANDKLMVLAFRRGIHVINTFTSDRALLRARLDMLLDDASLVDTASFEEEAQLEQLRRESGRSAAEMRPRVGRSTGMDRSPFGSVTTGLSFQCESLAREAEIETSRALRAMTSTMPAFGALSGRKALILFTETLRDDPGGPYYEACRLSSLARPSLGLTVVPEIEDLARKANLAGVSFYPVHAGGLSPLGTSTGEHSARGLQASLALSTGGRNSVLMKDKLLPFRQAAADMSCHYVLAYRPTKDLKPGRHAIRVAVKQKGLKARYREFFTLETPRAVSESEMLAALSSPGLYHDLEVEVHGYSLSQVGSGRRRFLLKASVPVKDLSLIPTAAQRATGALRIRGGLISDNTLRCEFDRTISISVSQPPTEEPIRAGLEAFCDLVPGDYELVVTARDEMGGSLGSFWGRTGIKSSPKEAGPGVLLWTGGAPDFWAHAEPGSWLEAGNGDPLFLNRSLTFRHDEPAALTLMACRSGADRKVEVASTGSQVSLHLEGPRPVDLAMGPAIQAERGECRLLLARIPAGALSSGSYLTQPRVPAGWRSMGNAIRIDVR